MSYNKGTLDAYRKIVTKELEARNLRLTGSLFAGGGITAGGNLVITGSISGSSYLGVSASAGVSSVAASGSSNLTGGVYFTGSGDNVITQSGQVITISGSPDLVAVTGVAASGSADLTGKVYFTGSGDNSITQDGQVITISGSASTSAVIGVAASGSSDLTGKVYITGSTPNIVASQSGQVIQLALAANVTFTNVTGSSSISGSAVYGKDAVLTNVTATNITGSTISGSFLGTSAVVRDVTATNVTGSASVSGSAIYGANAVITNVTSTNITGSIISGSSYLGVSATIANITGSSLVSGSNFLGPTATVTNINTTNITGSLFSGSDFRGSTATITYVNATNVTGSSSISGSSIYGATAAITNITSTNVTGSNSISGSSVFGKDAVIMNITSIYVTGSTLVSGSTLVGATANITNVNAVNVTGSSLLSGSDIRGATATITNIVATNVTGSSVLSGSNIYGNSAVLVYVTSTSITGSTISGSTYQGDVVTSINNSGSANLAGAVTFTGSGIVSLSESGQVITISGSQTEGAVTGLANSGSSLLTGEIYLTGSQNVSITQSGQSITISGSSDANTLEGLTANQVRTHAPASHGSSHTSGSGDAVSIYKSQITNLHTEQLNIPSFTATGSASSGITGSLYVTGTISGAAYEGITTSTHASTHAAGSTDALTGNFVFTNLTVTNITGSTLVSGSEFRGPLAVVTNIVATNVTGSSILSGANIYGPAATITSLISTNVTATNITGSNLLSGSVIRGPIAYITNVVATNVTGSIISGSNIYGPSANITNVYVTNLTGSGTLSGSLIRGSTVSGSGLGIAGNAVITGNLSGSTISGSITMNMDGNARVSVRQNSGGTSYTRRRINFIEGTNTSFTIGDDAVSEEVDVTITSNTGSGELPASYVIWSSSGVYYAQNGHTGVITSNVNAYPILQGAISSITGSGARSGKLFIKSGYYPITGSTLNISFTAGVGGSFIMEGESLGSYAGGGVTIYGTGSKVLDVTNTSWNGVSYLKLKDLSFYHDVYTDLDTTLDTLYSHIQMDNIRIINTNDIATDSLCYSGSAVIAGPSASSGYPCSWYNVETYGYKIAYNLILDHLMLYNSIANYPGIYAYIFSGSAVNIHLIAPQVNVGAKFDTIKPFTAVWTSTPIFIKDAHIEMAASLGSDLGQPIFSGSWGPNGFFDVVGFFIATGSYYPQMKVSPVDPGSLNNVTLRSHALGCTTYNNGYALINSSSGSFAHNLVSLPKSVILTASGSIPLETSWLPSGSTGVWVYHNGTPPVGVYWKAEV